MLNENFEVVDNLKIKYLFKPRKYDCNYLVVVFSGFGASSYFTYDLKKSLLNVHSNILWIKDDFYGNVCYYHTANGEVVHDRINKFILNFSQSIGVIKENIILCGFSKGGTAALFYGAYYNYKNIISTVPQFRIATYCKNSKKQDVINHIGVDESLIDNFLLSAISADINREKNIYFLTSEQDEQYSSQIKNHISNLYKYRNFNLFLSESILVRSHNLVTAHHLQLVLSWIYALSSGVTPVFGISILKGDSISSSNHLNLSNYHVDLRELKVVDKKIYPQGVGFIRLINHSKYHEVDFILIFKNLEDTYSFDLAQDHKPALTRDFYDGNFVIYDKSWFCTYKYNGLDISIVKPGLYKMYLKIIAHNVKQSIEVPLVSSSLNNISHDFINIIKADDGLYIEILN